MDQKEHLCIELKVPGSSQELLCPAMPCSSSFSSFSASFSSFFSSSLSSKNRKFDLLGHCSNFGMPTCRLTARHSVGKIGEHDGTWNIYWKHVEPGTGRILIHMAAIWPICEHQPPFFFGQRPVNSSEQPRSCQGRRGPGTSKTLGLKLGSFNPAITPNVW